MVEIKTNNDLSEKRAEKRKQLERQLSKNTIKMNKLKTKEINCKYKCFF